MLFRSSRPVTLDGPHFISDTYFNDSSLSLESATDGSILNSLGLRRGFAMNAPLGEDLLVFGVQKSSSGTTDFSGVSIAASYDPIVAVPDEFGPGQQPNYQIEFGDTSSYRIVDLNTNTEVSTGTLDSEKRTVAFGTWKVTFDDLPQKGDVFAVSKTDAPLDRKSTRLNSSH